MKKIFNFRRGNLKNGRRVKIEVELTEDNVFTARCIGPAKFWGQAFDAVNTMGVKSLVFDKIYKFWKLYHMNDMHAGTIEQENALKNIHYTNGRYDYEEACTYLKFIGLYEVKYKGNMYKYGHGWIKYDIPAYDLAEIKSLLNENIA